MLQSIVFTRRSGRALFAPLSLALLASCGRDQGIPLPERPRAAAVQVLSRNPAIGVAGQRLPDTVVIRAVDAQGQPVAGARFTLQPNPGAYVIPEAPLTDAHGYIKAVWELGTQPGLARPDGDPSVARKLMWLRKLRACAPSG